MPRAKVLAAKCAKKQSGPGSVRFGYGLGVERFDRFRFSVPAVPLQKGFSVFQYILKGKDGSGSGFGSWKTVPVPVPLSVSGKTVLTVPVRFLTHPEEKILRNEGPRVPVVQMAIQTEKIYFRINYAFHNIRTRSTTTRDRFICNFGVPSPLEALH